MNKILIIIIAIVIIAGGIYLYWGRQQGEEEPLTAVDQELQKIETVSESNAAETISAELDATQLDNLDKEFTDIEAEIDAALSGL